MNLLGVTVNLRSFLIYRRKCDLFLNKNNIDKMWALCLSTLIIVVAVTKRCNLTFSNYTGETKNRILFLFVDLFSPFA